MSDNDPIVEAVAKAIARETWARHKLLATRACDHCLDAAWDGARVAVATARPLIVAEAQRSPGR